MARSGGGRRVYFEVRVPLVTVESSGPKSFALYMLNVSYDTNSWPVARRFREFDGLAATLKRLGVAVPSLPTKLGIGRSQLGKAFLESRRQALEVFLRRLLGDSSPTGLDGVLRPPWAFPPLDRFLQFSDNAMSSTVLQLEGSHHTAGIVELLHSEGLLKRPSHAGGSGNPVEELFDEATAAAPDVDGGIVALETSEALLRQAVGTLQDRIETIRSFHRALKTKEEAFMDVLSKTHVKISKARTDLTEELRRRKLLREQIQRDAEAEFRAAADALSAAIKFEQLQRSYKGLLMGHAATLSACLKQTEGDALTMSELGLSLSTAKHHHSKAWKLTQKSQPSDGAISSDATHGTAQDGMRAALECGGARLVQDSAERPIEAATRTFANFQGEAVRLLCLIDRLACVQ